MSLNHEERTDVVTYRLEKAARTFEQVKFNLPSHYWELIANRMYYAVYYAVSALLIANGYTTKTHAIFYQGMWIGITKAFITHSQHEKLPLQFRVFHES